MLKDKISQCSPDGVQRNLGNLDVAPSPHFATLHPGYVTAAAARFNFVVRQQGA